MQHPRIAELLEPFLSPADSPEPALSEAKRLTANDLNHISIYIDILRRWNARINLTAIRDEEEIVTRHFGESLFAAQHLFPRGPSVTSSVSLRVKDFDVDVDVDAAEAQSPKPAPRVADLGSGAGFPGIPIKLWDPETAVTLIESNQKKATFLREVIRALTLTNINVFPARAEQLPATQPTLFDVVTLRAVERFTEILPTAATLLAPAGRLALLIGASQQAEARSTLPSFRWQPPIPIPQSTTRVLQIGRPQIRQEP